MSWPLSRTKCLSRRHLGLDRLADHIQRGQHLLVSKPVRRFGASHVQREEYEDGRAKQAHVERRGRDVVVLEPPARLPPPDEEVEDGAHDSPAVVDEHRRRREHSGSAEDEGEVDVSPDRAGITLGEEPRDDGCDGADQPEPLQTAVEGLAGEHASRADGAPDHGSRVEDLGLWAGELICLVVLADVGDVAERPVHDGDLDNRRPHRGHQLGREHDPGRDLHIMAEFEILGEVQSLRHDQVSVVLKHHHGERAAGDHVADDVLGEDVQAELEIGDGLHDTDRDCPDHGDGQADDKRPPGKASVPCTDHHKGKGKHDGKKHDVPPVLGIAVLLHQAHMDIVFLVAGQLPLSPDGLPVVESNVNDDGGYSGEREAIGDGELGR